MTAIDRRLSGTDSRKSSGRSTPKNIGQIQTVTPAVNLVPTINTENESTNPLFGATSITQVKIFIKSEFCEAMLWARNAA